MPLRLEGRPVGDVLVVQCFGRLVLGDEVQALQAYFAERRDQYRGIVLQLDEIKFVDSSGLGALVRLMHTTRAKQGDVKLCCLQPTLLRVMEITNLTKLFKIYDSVEEAVMASRSSSHSSDGHADSSSVA